MSPCEWNPNRNNLKPYWKKHQDCLTVQDMASMENDYTLDLNEKFDVVVIDGSIRPLTMHKVKIFLVKMDVTYIVVDNTESEMISEAADAMVPRYFRRLDFPATEEDEIPPHQYGKWVTTIYMNTNME